MAFFRTKDRQGDRSIGTGARQQRRQQLQAQQQMQTAQKAALSAGEPAPEQGRAKGLYDEQLQRELQERRLFKEAPATPAPNEPEPAAVDG
jgi:hypothetical protein